jgi:hypothetical protein
MPADLACESVTMNGGHAPDFGTIQHEPEVDRLDSAGSGPRGVAWRKFDSLQTLDCDERIDYSAVGARCSDCAPKGES